MIHMQLNTDRLVPDKSIFASLIDLTFVVGDPETAARMPQGAPLQPFSEPVIAFLNDLSKKLLQVGKAHSDVTAFGFWCRRSALLREKEKYDDLPLRLGRGIVFHSTPSNVPVNFAFSFASALLAGNANIVRLPAKDYEQVSIICGTIRELLAKEHKDLAPYICMVKYPPNKEITDIFSILCDSRIVWGGDGTIEEMRNSPLKPRANEITFADRYSIAAIDADEYLRAEDQQKIALDFYNDTYLNDQNACTSPKLIVWLGKEKERAKAAFWEYEYRLVKEKYTLQPVYAVKKLESFYKAALKHEMERITSGDNFIYRVSVHTLSSDLFQVKNNCGFFYEYDVDDLAEILPVCSERCQTLTYYGLDRERLKRFLIERKPRGIDRMVPMGRSLDFTLTWDGYDLIRSLSRKVSIL